MLGASFLTKVMTYVLIYYYQFFGLHEVEAVKAVLSMSVSGMRPSYFLFSIGMSSFRFLQLTGLYMLICINHKQFLKSNVIIILFSFFMITYFSHNSYFVFHLTAMLLLLIVAYHYYLTYRSKKKLNTMLLVISFIIIALSQLIFMFETIRPIYYVAAELIQLFGYSLLLLTFILILKNGKKKKPNRHRL